MPEGGRGEVQPIRPPLWGPALAGGCWKSSYLVTGDPPAKAGTQSGGRKTRYAGWLWRALLVDAVFEHVVVVAGAREKFVGRVER